MSSIYIGLPFNLGSAYIELRESSLGIGCESHPRDLELWAGRLHMTLSGPDRIEHNPTSALERIDTHDWSDDAASSGRLSAGSYRVVFDDDPSLPVLHEWAGGRTSRLEEIIAAGSAILLTMFAKGMTKANAEGLPKGPPKTATAAPQDAPEHDPVVATMEDAEAPDQPLYEGRQDLPQDAPEVLMIHAVSAPADDAQGEPTSIQCASLDHGEAVNVHALLSPLHTKPTGAGHAPVSLAPAEPQVVLRGTVGDDMLVLCQDVSTAKVEGGEGTDTLVVTGDVDAVSVTDNEDGTFTLQFVREETGDQAPVTVLLDSVEQVELDGAVYQVEDLAAVYSQPSIDEEISLVGLTPLQEQHESVI